MRRGRLPAWLLGLVVLVGVWPDSSWAIPVFARKYGFNCTMCHSAYPRLNDFGARYRMNGYRLPGRESVERTVLEGPVPFAMRTSAGYARDRFENTPEAEGVNQFQLDGLDLFSGGLLGRRVGYLVVYPPRIEPSRGVVGQTGTLEMASVVFSDLYTSWVNVRAGRFEPEFAALSPKRRLSVSPYEIYDFAFPGGIALSATQTGVEVTGHGAGGFAYAVGWVDGSESNRPDDGPGDFYGRVAKVFGEGEGLTAGQRVGLIAYSGRARSVVPLAPDSRETFMRVGADASLNLGSFNLALVYVWGRDDETLWNATSDAEFSGGFAELSFQPIARAVAFARYDHVRTPDVLDRDISRITAGARYYLEDNLALHGEYSHRSQEAAAGAAGDATEDLLTVRLDFAF